MYETYLNGFAVFVSRLTTHISAGFHMRAMLALVARFVNVDATCTAPMQTEKRKSGGLLQFLIDIFQIFR